MEDTYLLDMPSVKKKILAGGTGPMPHFPTGTKLVFHFQTLLDDFERTVIDDSRLAKRPAEIFVGKMFKMEVWESLLTSMRVGEVAEFWCDAVHTGLYPIVSKGMRLIAQGKDPLEGQRHTCGMGNVFHYHSTGFPELDELMRTPQPLIFIMELLQVGDPMSYQRESWMMEKDEKMETVPLLHMQGDALVHMQRYEDAASKYKEAVLLLKVVQSREMPGDIDYINLGRMIVPLELNYCQCMLQLERYYEVIEHASELLDKHKDCVKGYYKRAKAHTAVWNETEARRDLNTVVSLDPTLASLVHRELRQLSDRMKEKYWEEREQYWQKLGKTPTTLGDQEEEEEEEGEESGQEEEEGEEGGDNEDEKERGIKGSAEVVDEAGDGSEGGDGRRKDEETRPGEGEGGDDEEAGGRGGGGGGGAETRPSESPADREAMDWQQMLRMVMFLQDEGNFHMKESRYEDAAGKYREAAEYVDVLQYKVDRKGDDWESLEKVRLPLTLNLSGCLLELQQYQQVVELNTKLLKKHKGNCKAVYQRARAHSALCHEDRARQDFLKLQRLDPKLQPVVRQELKKLGENLRCLHAQRKKTYWQTSQEKWARGGSSRAGATGATDAEAVAVRTPKKCVKFATTAVITQPRAEQAGGEEGTDAKGAGALASASTTAGLDGAERESLKSDVKLEDDEGEDEEKREGREKGVECARVESNEEEEAGREDGDEGREEGMECAKVTSITLEEEEGKGDEKEEEEGREEGEVGVERARAQSNKAESVVPQGDGQGAPDNGPGDGESAPVQSTGAAEDNVASERPGSDKSGRNAVKCQSTAAIATTAAAATQGQGSAHQGNNGANNGQGNGRAGSDAADGSALPQATCRPTRDAEDGPRLDEGRDRSATEQGGQQQQQQQQQDVDGGNNGEYEGRSAVQ